MKQSTSWQPVSRIKWRHDVIIGRDIMTLYLCNRNSHYFIKRTNYISRIDNSRDNYNWLVERTTWYWLIFYLCCAAWSVHCKCAIKHKQRIFYPFSFCVQEPNPAPSWQEMVTAVSLCLCSVMSDQSFCGKDEGFCGKDKGFLAKTKDFLLFLHLCHTACNVYIAY